MVSLKRILILARIVFIALIINQTVYAADSFIANKIRVQGLQKISLSTVLSYLPIKEGEEINATKTADIIRNLYKTGFFSNVELYQQGTDTLLIVVEERLIIGSIEITGNKEITKKQLLDALKSQGFYEGQPFDYSVLAMLKSALAQQYVSTGHYNVKIDEKIVSVERNRVLVKIIIDEGATAKIKSIKIFGNKAFSRRKLLFNFESTTFRPYSFLTHSDQYSKEKFDKDLETLRNYYLDHGFLRFKITDTKINISPNRKRVDIEIYLVEGPVYKISGWDFTGDLLGHEDEMRKLISIKVGDVFSRRKVLETNSKIAKFFGDYGYANPDIKLEPSVDDADQKVFIRFNINPGRRFYVRRINFSGNLKTREYVLRREVRQQEGALFSGSKISETIRRLNNLGYLQEVTLKTEPVPGVKDQVDLTFDFKEVSSASANLQVGYSDTNGLVYGASLHDQNFLGTGRGVGLQFNQSEYTGIYNFTYFNPYFTENNISFRLEAYDQETQPGEIHLSRYDTNSYGVSAIYGIPLSDYSHLSLGYGFEHTRISPTRGTPPEILAFIAKYDNIFNTIKLIAGWSYSKLDRYLFPTMGFANSLDVDIGIPTGLHGGNLEYYKASYEAVYYKPILKFFIMRLSGDLGYGNGYGDMQTLPFFKNFFCGGIGSVRGYEGNTLGPRDSTLNPIGGNVLTDVSLAIIFPNPLGDTVRTSAFVDAGNVFQNQFVLDGQKGIRTSAGVQLEWKSPLGAVITLSLAEALNAKMNHTNTRLNDKLAFFQFNFGANL